MKLLVVDDHTGVRAIIRELAAPLAREIRECDSGEAALAAARDYLPDLVTMDARMPGIGGIEACRVLQRQFPGINVAVVSAYDSPDLREAALQAGAVAFVAKDNLEELRPIFRRWLGNRAHPDTPQSDTPAEA